jgi:hypothetical protein
VPQPTTLPRVPKRRAVIRTIIERMKRPTEIRGKKKKKSKEK